MVNISEFSVVLLDDPRHPDTFQLTDDNKGMSSFTVSSFRLSSQIICVVYAKLTFFSPLAIRVTEDEEKVRRFQLVSDTGNFKVKEGTAVLNSIVGNGCPIMSFYCWCLSTVELVSGRT